MGRKRFAVYEEQLPADALCSLPLYGTHAVPERSRAILLNCCLVCSLRCAVQVC
jgi:hypothetical protein